MSLATRCASCGTIFRVVQDQLKVCDGWVRCGRCDEVFNALEGLFDLERDRPPGWSPEDGLPVIAPADAAPAEATASTEQAPEPPPEDVGGGPRQYISTPDGLAVGNALPNRQSLKTGSAGEFEELVSAEPANASRGIDGGPAHDDAATAPTADPEFVRHARLRARWTQPRLRATLATAGLVLLGALALQAVHHFRDDVVARWTGTAPALSAWCRWIGCRVEAPQRLDSITLESSTLQRVGPPDGFRLSVGLRNRGMTIAAMPHIELSLTDSAGHLVSRRALTPADFRVMSTTLLPGAEANLQLLLAAGSARVTGYTVEIFYP